MRRSSVPFPVRVLLLGRSQGLPLTVTPAAPRVVPGGTIAFTAASGPSAGASDLTVSPATLALTAGSTRVFSAEGL